VVRNVAWDALSSRVRDDKRARLGNNLRIEAPPKWFVDAVSTPYETGNVEVDGCAIRFSAWRARQPGGAVHGAASARTGGLHRRFWPINGVVAPDLSGHGMAAVAGLPARGVGAVMAIVETPAFRPPS
jgi:hypothetical protein